MQKIGGGAPCSLVEDRLLLGAGAAILFARRLNCLSLRRPYAGAGANFFFTNAGDSQQLAGPFTTVSINVGYSVANLGVQLSFGGGIWQLSITPPIASVGFGAAGSVIRTNTIATHKGCH
jgi:hypothetical protein